MSSRFSYDYKPRMKIAVVGHSYIKRMPKFFLTRATVRKFCYGGAHASTFPTSFEYEELQKFDPDLIYLQIGGNDINRNSSPEVIAEYVIDLVSQWMNRGIPVLVGEIEHRTRPRGMTVGQYDRQRRHLNGLLHEQFEDTFIRFSFSMVHYLSHDGVHLNPEGGRLFSKDVQFHLRRFGARPEVSHCATGHHWKRHLKRFSKLRLEKVSMQSVMVFFFSAHFRRLLPPSGGPKRKKKSRAPREPFSQAKSKDVKR